MKAFVIYQEQVKQYSLLLIAALLIAFVSGYYTGKQSDSVAQVKTPEPAESQAMNKDVVKDISKQLLVDDSSGKDSKQGNNKAQASKTTEKKQAEKKAAEKKLAEKKQAEKKAAEKKAAQKKLAEKKAAEKKAAQKKLAEKKAAEKKLAEKKAAEKKLVEKKAAEKKAAANKESASQPLKQTASSTETLVTQQAKANTMVDGAASKQQSQNKRIYSIQAGMFASKANAESFIGKLENRKFDAYVSEFQSTSGTIKYNVRVGRFDEREKARTLLKEFQKSFSSPAYVVITQ